MLCFSDSIPDLLRSAGSKFYITAAVVFRWSHRWLSVLGTVFTSVSVSVHFMSSVLGLISFVGCPFACSMEGLWELRCWLWLGDAVLVVVSMVLDLACGFGSDWEMLMCCGEVVVGYGAAGVWLMPCVIGFSLYLIL
ncbi:hypothetical protein A2U01_0028416 [Trifolium medium]|uniref:Transmembrane protein n=1 Tax=Trifolium medium TaxID=97028 RepID=A0A392P7G2_9FABA|nr:hypothetical protein [Trifolium medium]